MCLAARWLRLWQASLMPTAVARREVLGWGVKDSNALLAEVQRHADSHASAETRPLRPLHQPHAWAATPQELHQHRPAVHEEGPGAHPLPHLEHPPPAECTEGALAAGQGALPASPGATALGGAALSPLDLGFAEEAGSRVVGERVRGWGDQGWEDLSREGAGEATWRALRAGSTEQWTAAAACLSQCPEAQPRAYLPPTAPATRPLVPALAAAGSVLDEAQCFTECRGAGLLSPAPVGAARGGLGAEGVAHAGQARAQAGEGTSAQMHREALPPHHANDANDANDANEARDGSGRHGHATLAGPEVSPRHTHRAHPGLAPRAGMSAEAAAAAAVNAAAAAASAAVEYMGRVASGGVAGAGAGGDDAHARAAAPGSAAASLHEAVHTFLAGTGGVGGSELVAALGVGGVGQEGDAEPEANAGAAGMACARSWTAQGARERRQEVCMSMSVCMSVGR